MEFNKGKIATDYQEFVDLANELTERDVVKYPLGKREKQRERFERHLIGMIELYNIRYGSISSIHNRLDIFKEIAEWLSNQHEYEETLVPKIEEYLNTNIKELEKRLEEFIPSASGKEKE